MWDYNSSVLNPYAPLQRRTVARVNGKPGADAYKMGPNEEVLLLDVTAPIIWLKTTDSASYPTLTAYDITPHVEAAPPDYKTLEDRLKKLEEAIYAKSDAEPAKSE